MKLALHHPEKFSFAGALSAAIDAPRRRFNGSEGRRANDPFLLVSAADPRTAPYFYLTCGRQEGLLAPNREFAALLDRYRIAHEFHEVPGGHDWNQWNAQLPGLFDALRKQF